MRQIILIDDQNARSFRGLILPGAYSLLAKSDTFAYGAINGTDALGALVCSVRNLAANVESIYVREDARRAGVGLQLLTSAVEDCAEVMVSKLSMRYVLPDTEAVSMQALLERGGFSEFSTGCEYYCAPVEQLAKARVVTQAKALVSGEPITPFSRLGKRMIDEMFARFSESVPELARDSYIRDNLRPEISTAFVRGGMILGAVVFTGRPDVPTLSMAFALPAARDALPRLIAASMLAASVKYKPDTEIRFAAMTPESREMISLLLEGREVRALTEHFAVRYAK